MVLDVSEFLQEVLAGVEETPPSGWGPAVIDAVDAGTLPAPLTWLIKTLLPWGGLVFGLFSGGIGLATLFIASALIGHLERTVRHIAETAQKAAAFFPYAKDFKSNLAKLMTIAQRQAALESVPEEERRREDVELVMSEIQGALRTYELWKTTSSFREPDMTDMFPGADDDGPPEGMTPEMIEERIAALKAITPQHVYDLININPANKGYRS